MTLSATINSQLDDLYERLGTDDGSQEREILAEIAEVRRKLKTLELADDPVRCSLSRADAVVGAAQLRAMAKVLPMPEESRQLLTRIAECLEAAR